MLDGLIHTSSHLMCDQPHHQLDGVTRAINMEKVIDGCYLIFYSGVTYTLYSLLLFLFYCSFFNFMLEVPCINLCYLIFYVGVTYILYSLLLFLFYCSFILEVPCIDLCYLTFNDDVTYSLYSLLFSCFTSISWI